MLDAARELVLRGGPAAASARAVATAIGAPSGSVYHRFPRRDDLVAATWLRAQDRFLAGYLDTLAGSGPEAAVGVLTWSGANPDDAAVLLRYGLRDLVRREVSAGLSEHANANQRRLETAIARFAGAVERPVSDVLLAVVDLPYAVTRRILRAGRSPTGAEVDSLHRAASLLLAGGR